MTRFKITKEALGNSTLSEIYYFCSFRYMMAGDCNTKFHYISFVKGVLSGTINNLKHISKVSK
jgi:hypothetical protein